MRWQPGDDQSQQDTADQLSAAFPSWWVMWRPYQRLYCGFWCGNVQVPPQEHADPMMLARQLRYVEHALAAGRTP